MSTSQSTAKTTSIHPAFAEELPETVESPSQVKEAYRKTVMKVHPDQSDGDTAEDFKKVDNQKDFLVQELEEGTNYRIRPADSQHSYEEHLDHVDIEGLLSEGIEVKGENSEFDTDYEVNHINDDVDSPDIYSAVLEDNESNLMIGLEIEPDYSDSQNAIHAEATYFTDHGKGQEENKGVVNLESVASQLGYEEMNDESLSEASEIAIKQIGGWATEYGETEIKP